VRIFRWFTVGALISGLVIPLGTRAGAASPSAYQVTIQRTAGGIPHITGANFGDVGYGFGYAFAQDNICTMAEDYVTVAAQRSRYFGQSATYTVEANGTTLTNIDSDIFWQDVSDSGTIGRLLAVRSGPGAVSPQLQAGVQGYVDGYNAYLHDVGGTAGVPDGTCRGKPWVRPITTGDAYLRFYQLVELASQDVAIQGISEAAPPPSGLVGGLPSGAPTTLAPGTQGLPGMAQITELGKALDAAAAGGLGSNAVAVGSDGTRDRSHGLLLGNPHFPWTGQSASIRRSSPFLASSTSRAPRCSESRSS
jgi:acyl-homoserine-lactone acylase